MNNSYVTCFDNTSMLPDLVDAIFVINQEVSPEQIASVVLERKIKHLIIISTHAPFPDEHAKFRALSGHVRFWWIPMSWLLTDSEMEGCDERAVGELTAGNERIDLGRYYRRSRYLRNELAASQLAQHVRWKFCYVSEGLGVVSKAWPNAMLLGADLHQPARPHGSFCRSIVERLKKMRRVATIQIIEDDTESYAFLGSTRRLRFRNGVLVRSLRTSFIALRSKSEITILKRLVSKAVATSGEKVFRVATTVHNFSPWMLDVFPDLRVFVDGLHPPNYPISNGAGYRGALIVSREDCDRQWFEKCGCVVLPSPRILAPECDYGVPCRPRPIRNVCLMLNHAGDWSALIDRSDTDLVVMEFVEAATRAPQFFFRIRPHPTMAMVEHEGIYSHERLLRWVRNINLPNLEFSQSSLEEDFEWTDCCVSEYSNVLVDCMKADKACVALNPTNRRNFLKHLESLGLPVASNSVELVAMLVTLSDSQ